MPNSCFDLAAAYRHLCSTFLRSEKRLQNLVQKHEVLLIESTKKPVDCFFQFKVEGFYYGIY